MGETLCQRSGVGIRLEMGRILGKGDHVDIWDVLGNWRRAATLKRAKCMDIDSSFISLPNQCDSSVRVRRKPSGSEVIWFSVQERTLEESTLAS